MFSIRSRRRWLVFVVLVVGAGCQEAGLDEYEEGTPFLPGSPLDASIRWDGGWESNPDDTDRADGGTPERSPDANPGSPRLDAGEGPEDPDAVVEDAEVPVEDAAVLPDQGDPADPPPPPPWEPPDPPGALFCNGPADAPQACRWMADCFASQRCPSASSEAAHHAVELHCHHRFTPPEIVLLCRGVSCSELASLTPLCQRLAH